MTKICTDCGQTKALEDFNNYAASEDGKARNCRACAKARRDQRKGAAVQNTKATTTATAALKANVARTGSDFIIADEIVATFAALQLSAQDGEPAANMAFHGPSGSGKTSTARELARRAGLPFFQVDATAQVDPESWFGTREVVDGDKGPVTKYNESLFVKAIQQPCLLLIDEFNRVSDDVRQVMLPLWDDSRQVTNPLTGQPVHRHPLCFIITTANEGVQFTGTKAVDPAFTTRAYHSNFDYLPAPQETALLIGRMGIDADQAALLVSFATVTRERAAGDEDFPAVSTRELLAAAKLAARGLDIGIAVKQAIINGADEQGGGESIRASLTYLWEGKRNPDAQPDDDTNA